VLVLEISLPGLRGRTFELLKWGQMSLIDGTNLQSYQVLFRLIFHFKVPRICTDI